MSEPATQENASQSSPHSAAEEAALSGGINDQLVQQLADRVWALIKQELEIEQERLRSGRGPQPWLRGGR